MCTYCKSMRFVSYSLEKKKGRIIFFKFIIFTVMKESFISAISVFTFCNGYNWYVMTYQL